MERIAGGRPGRWADRYGRDVVCQIAVPAQDGVRADEELQSAQDLAGQPGQKRGEKGPVLGCESDFGVSAELAFKDGDLVAQGENLDILVPIAHGQ
ncbi:hypothetical protein ABZ912_58895 [Nonomuraea angiospora]|uniref:hypothetical protein n=1 Tax=Nonomuraea angiospora TaxID=46172 RepID=UPI0033EE2035